jgi:hypothetical protein
MNWNEVLQCLVDLKLTKKLGVDLITLNKNNKNKTISNNYCHQKSNLILLLLLLLNRMCPKIDYN